MTRMSDNIIKEELESKFERGQVKKREGKYEYVELRPVVQRLNDALGYDGWSFRVTDTAEADKMLMVWGELTVHGDTHDAVRMQCGRKSVIFRRDSDEPLDIGNDWKAATSDCIKKCATLLGVGLYLGDDEYQPESGNDNPPPRDTSQGSKSPSTSTNGGKSIGDLKTEAFELERSIMRLTGEATMNLRKRVLDSTDLPGTETGLLDYQTALNDLLEEGKTA